MARITLTVNDAQRVVDVAPETPLIYVLQNDLQLVRPPLGLRDVAMRGVRGSCRRQGDSLVYDTGLLGGQQEDSHH